MSTGNHIFLIEKQIYGKINTKIDEDVFSVDVGGQEDMMQLNEESYDNGVWTNKVHIKVRIVL